MCRKEKGTFVYVSHTRTRDKQMKLNSERFRINQRSTSFHKVYLNYRIDNYKITQIYEERAANHYHNVLVQARGSMRES